MSRLRPPSKLRREEYIEVASAVLAALDNDMPWMHDHVTNLTPQGRAEVLACLEVLEQTLRVMVQRDVAASLLLPDSLPAGVEGIPIAGATR